MYHSVCFPIHALLILYIQCIILIGHLASLGREQNSLTNTTICDSKKKKKNQSGDLEIPRNPGNDNNFPQHYHILLLGPRVKGNACLCLEKNMCFLLTSPHVISLSAMYWLIIIYVLHGKARGHGAWSPNRQCYLYTHTKMFAVSCLLFSYFIYNWKWTESLKEIIKTIKGSVQMWYLQHS